MDCVIFEEVRTISDGGEIVGKHVGIKAAHRTEVIDDSVSVDEFAVFVWRLRQIEKRRLPYSVAKQKQGFLRRAKL